jgi:hypothetical protein
VWFQNRRAKWRKYDKPNGANAPTSGSPPPASASSQSTHHTPTSCPTGTTTSGYFGYDLPINDSSRTHCVNGLSLPTSLSSTSMAASNAAIASAHASAGLGNLAALPNSLASHQMQALSGNSFGLSHFGANLNEYQVLLQNRLMAAGFPPLFNPSLMTTGTAAATASNASTVATLAPSSAALPHSPTAHANGNSHHGSNNLLQTLQSLYAAQQTAAIQSNSSLPPQTSSALVASGPSPVATTPKSSGSTNFANYHREVNHDKISNRSTTGRACADNSNELKANRLKESMFDTMSSNCHDRPTPSPPNRPAKVARTCESPFEPEAASSAAFNRRKGKEINGRHSESKENKSVERKTKKAKDKSPEVTEEPLNVDEPIVD